MTIRLAGMTFFSACVMIVACSSDDEGSDTEPAGNGGSTSAAAPSPSGASSSGSSSMSPATPGGVTPVSAGEGTGGTGLGIAGSGAAGSANANAAGSAGAGGAGGASPGDSTVACGDVMCTAPTGLVALLACCRPDGACGAAIPADETGGIDVGGDATECLSLNPGTPDPACPAQSVMGFSLAGCCSEEGFCGADLSITNLGCNDVSALLGGGGTPAPPVPCGG